MRQVVKFILTNCTLGTGRFLTHTEGDIDEKRRKIILAGSSLLTLLDDIATLLDDISVMGKVAAKTAGVLGDDLSLNAQQVTGVRANRELPVVWEWRKGRSLTK